MKTIRFILLLNLSFFGAIAQVNVELLHQLVAESKAEYSRQTSARDRQGLVTTSELVNKNQTMSFKENFRKIQSRFTALGLAINLTQIGLEALPLLEEIGRQQAAILERCAAKPTLIPLALDSQADLLDKAHELLNYLYALSLDAGALNRMRPSDRKLLFSHIVTELKNIAGIGKGLESSLIHASGAGPLQNGSPFKAFVNQDRELIENILRQAKYIKP